MSNDSDGLRTSKLQDGTNEDPAEPPRIGRRAFVKVATGAAALVTSSSVVAGAESSDGAGYGLDGYGAGGYGGGDDSQSTDDSDGETDDPATPEISRLDLRDRSNPQWARVQVDWAVTHPDGTLRDVESTLTGDGWGSISESTPVSGSDADGDHDHRIRKGHGERYEVELTVTDAAGNTTVETATIAL